MTENTPSLVEVIREAREMWHMMSPRFKREVSMDEAIAKSLLAANLVGEGWRPIETAPRNGTTIDLWMDSGHRVADAYWGSPDPADDDLDEGWVKDRQYVRGEDETILAWRPLPAPPRTIP